ncbi:MAG: hypothetical protein JW797_12895 [Bradymonadales bacterium]|nr:hypothetical protein [Bradymonadales bacterium]
MTQTQPMEQPPEETPPPADQSEWIEPHREFLLRIDDASRLGYTLLGIGTIVAVVLLLVLTGTALFSLAGVGLVVFGGLAALIAGRLLGLSRQDRRLRRAVQEYCREHHLDLEQLVTEAAKTGRYQFVTKLFFHLSPPPGGPRGSPLE